MYMIYIYIYYNVYLKYAPGSPNVHLFCPYAYVPKKVGIWPKGWFTL